jgi:CBS domain-containing protein
MDSLNVESARCLVRDIMTRDIVTVAPDASVSEISRLMSERRISGVPVVDEEGRPLGVVTELDMVVRNTRFKLPAFFTLLNATIYLETPAHIKERLEHMLGLTAREIMSEKSMTVSADATIEDLAELMVGKQVNPIPVVENGKLAGIVSRADIVAWMARSAAGQ